VRRSAVAQPEQRLGSFSVGCGGDVGEAAAAGDLEFSELGQCSLACRRRRSVMELRVEAEMAGMSPSCRLREAALARVGCPELNCVAVFYLRRGWMRFPRCRSR
jgi:hypothetical protein